MLSPPFDYVRAEEHVLPYRVLFEELLQTGHGSRTTDGVSFPGLVAAVLQTPAPTIEEAERLLFQRITAVEDGYRKLAALKTENRYSVADEDTLNRLEAPLLQILHRLERSAICLSGGGIRSAALSLGVLQALARFRNAPPGPHYDQLNLTSALEEFDYLSTVSGGGYIGSWLTAWTFRVDKSAREAAARRKEPEPTPQEAFHHVARCLAGDIRHTSADPAQRPVRHLREYTSFLAPKLGFTLDTFTLAAIVLRNLFINWTMIVPILFAAVAALQVLRIAQGSHLGWVPAALSQPLWWTVTALLFLAAGIAAGRRLPSTLPPLSVAVALNQGERRVIAFFVAPLLLASLVLDRIWFNLGTGWIGAAALLLPRLIGISFSGLFAICLYRVARQFRGKRPSAGVSYQPWLYLFFGTVTSALVAGSLGLSIYALGSFAAAAFPRHAVPHRIAAAAHQAAGTPASLQSLLSSSLHWDTLHASQGAILIFPVLWVLIMLASSLYSALLARFEEDVDREWWARAGGLMTGILLLWILGIGLSAAALDVGSSASRLWAGAGLAGLLGLLGALGGSSTASAMGAEAAKKADIGRIGRFLSKHDLLLPLLCGVALLIAATVITVLEAKLAGLLSPGQPLRSHAVLLGVFLGLSLGTNTAININIFSLHGMYRMRLMRAFMGASNLFRRPNAFTGFDETDNVESGSIRTGPGVPLHLVNTTVNLVGTTNSAWRQRKAEGFTVSPLHSGGWRLGYTRTAGYGGPRGLTLATAMAISGAAFNPNMGYHSSPLVTLVMTMFNVRLGWWLPNPKFRSRKVRRAAKEAARNAADIAAKAADDPNAAIPLPAPLSAQEMVETAPPRLPALSSRFLKSRSPTFALRPLLMEAFGGTNDEGAYIELTDGGHFENLGLYEMVLRRVQWIVVVDGSADPHCQLEDLGNAMRKIEIDLGVPITFNRRIHMDAGSKEDNLYCALADIRYDIADCVPDPKRGQLLYIKAGLNGHEPPDVLQYARAHPAFPHETTANQFFTESQFESYRHLGQHEIAALLARVRWPIQNRPKCLTRALFAAGDDYTTVVTNNPTPRKTTRAAKTQPTPTTASHIAKGTNTAQTTMETAPPPPHIPHPQWHAAPAFTALQNEAGIDSTPGQRDGPQQS